MKVARAPLPTRDEWLAVLGDTLKRNGVEWHGPCPLCGTGEDRFRVMPDGGVFCRVCMPNGGPRFGEMLRLVFPERVRAREGNSAPRLASWGSGGGEGRSTAHTGVDEASRCEEARRRDAARRLWNSTCSLSGTVAEHYLRARGVGHVAGALSIRFHPRITHRNAPGRFPALVSGVQDVAGRFMGIQRTYLDGARKAAVDPVRASLGSLAGGGVRLGETVAGRVLVGEGIESTAAAMLVLDVPAALATLGTSGLRAVVLPASVRRVVIAADRDVEGEAAAAELAMRLRGEGRRVEVWMPDPRVCDFNDELMAMGGS